ncbi:hypothetical protein R3X27_13465 [Tropicimonas sp. TH_r6]|uniref:hypothetical protein n=1 Tax=Tropicimonas sp. TH_r6 TaxID=3082085 RepID=UPI002952F5B1|nr:hypothetical protein [Tropicimonas sp. TH_r6]MDV7143689.1 hypothetical protein [Tropicimonas sp. TH_r6]
MNGQPKLAPNQRALDSDEETDHDIEEALFIGVSWGHAGNVWRKDGKLLTRVGVPNFTPVPVEGTSTVSQTLRKQFTQNVVLHQMTLQPGQFYPRIARSTDQHPLDVPSFFRVDRREQYGSARHFSSLVRQLDEVLEAIEPTRENFDSYGNRTRNLLLLICTECENQMRGVLRANGVEKDQYRTGDFIRLLEPMRLNEYSVEFSEMPWLGEFRPFEQWCRKAPTKSLQWYDSYNAAKHDRAKHFHRASLMSVLEALAALWTLLSAQYGPSWRTIEATERIFTQQKYPRWRYSDVYCMAYPSSGFEPEQVRLFPYG